MKEKKQKLSPFSSENSKQSTTIEVNMEAYEKLHSVQIALQKILRKKQVSFSQVILTCFTVHPLEILIQEYILEEALIH